ASTFGGALEMAKRGLLKIHQEKNYGPIYIRRPGEKDDAPPPPAAPEEESGISAEDIAFAENDLAEQQAEEAAKEAERLAAEQALAEANAAPAARYVPSSDSEDDGEDDFGAAALSDTAPEAEASIDEADVEVALLETEEDETSAPDMQMAEENTEEVTVFEVVEETSAVEAAVEAVTEVAEKSTPRALTEEEEWEL
ncbi:MAG TPA: hypothetical protein DIW20_00990, partial [Rhodospirillaceae bacterium]|nr:hypothetical protein [Rhodospirillaceae bacterium]